METLKLYAMIIITILLKTVLILIGCISLGYGIIQFRNIPNHDREFKFVLDISKFGLPGTYEHNLSEYEKYKLEKKTKIISCIFTLIVGISLIVFGYFKNDSVNWTIKVLYKYIDFRGRARRKEYWMFFLFNLIIGIAATMLAYISKEVFRDFNSDLIPVLFYLFLIIPGIAVTIRRLHDVNIKGLLILIGLIPIIGTIWLLVLMVLNSSPGENQYGPNPKEVIVG